MVGFYAETMSVNEICFQLKTLFNDFNYMLHLPTTTPLGWWECDLFVLTKSMLYHEFEIKRSVVDLKRDFKTKKRKHSCLKYRANSPMKLPVIGDYDIRRAIPNYYWLVLTFDYDIDQLPDYCGVIKVDVNDKTVTDNFHFGYTEHQVSMRRLKNAPRLHNNKVSEKVFIKLVAKLNIRYWNLKHHGNRKLEIEKYKNKAQYFNPTLSR